MHGHTPYGCLHFCLYAFSRLSHATHCCATRDTKIAISAQVNLSSYEVGLVFSFLISIVKF
jgi:hypothetical protein